MAAPVPVMDVAELEAFFDRAFPTREGKDSTSIVEIRPGWVRLVLEPDERHLRPGNLVSGPTQMGLADRAAYAVIIAHIGPVAMAVTSNLNFSFLRGVQLRAVHCDAELLKLGKRLATVDCRLWQDAPDNVVAQAVVTYAIPG
jgi:uncharacterized protein (TIGR00369 family)